MTGVRIVGRLRKLCGNLATSSFDMAMLARNTRPFHHVASEGVDILGLA